MVFLNPAAYPHLDCRCQQVILPILGQPPRSLSDLTLFSCKSLGVALLQHCGTGKRAFRRIELHIIMEGIDISKVGNSSVIPVYNRGGAFNHLQRMRLL